MVHVLVVSLLSLLSLLLLLLLLYCYCIVSFICFHPLLLLLFIILELIKLRQLHISPVIFKTSASIIERRLLPNSNNNYTRMSNKCGDVGAISLISGLVVFLFLFLCLFLFMCLFLFAANDYKMPIR